MLKALSEVAISYQKFAFSQNSDSLGAEMLRQYYQSTHRATIVIAIRLPTQAQITFVNSYDLRVIAERLFVN
ncbi:MULTISPECIES: hypothetical protein [Shewanella]|uniref:hypothetical protein n=1 Tax=Shewanella TaxID=22 RepID=UPI001183211A|nr:MULTISPECIES: hypothetical protein [Shewanella]QYJ91773.1 hypothetical protein K0H81_09500 [Shewanella halotolerans]